MGQAKTHGFAKSQRLRRAPEFRRVMAEGRKQQTAHFVVFSRRVAGPARIGLTVGRRVGGAVLRNALKRRLRELYRLRQAQMGDKELVIVAKSGSGGLALQDLLEELAPVLISRPRP
jgi:ribonuclease P protein component